MTDQEILALDGAAKGLARILAASEKFVPEFAKPAPGSPMAQAQAIDYREAYDYGGLLIFAAEDHVRSILTLMRTKENPIPTFALWTLFRTAAEAIVRARHLLDLTIDDDERLARALNERLDNLDEQQKAAVDQTHYAAAVANLISRAAAHGITVVQNKNGKTIGFNANVPSEVELFTTYLAGGEKLFRYLGSFVHSRPWAMLKYADAEPTEVPTMSNVPVQLNVLLFAQALTALTSLVDEVVGNWAILGGYPLLVWSEAKKAPPSS